MYRDLWLKKDKYSQNLSGLSSPLLMSQTNDCVRFQMTWSKVFVKFTHLIFIEIDISLKNGNKKLSTVLKIHKMKFKFKAYQHGPLER